VFEHNGIPVTLAEQERCCGMPKLELGDLDAVVKAKEYNIPVLAKLVDEGWDLTALVPSCVLMFKQELPLMFPGRSRSAESEASLFRSLRISDAPPQGRQAQVGLQAAAGQSGLSRRLPPARAEHRPEDREALSLVPDTVVEIIERCSGHDGTYAVKKEFHESAMKIVMPVVDRVRKSGRNITAATARWRPPYPERPQGRRRAGTPDHLAAPSLRDMNPYAI